MALPDELVEEVLLRLQIDEPEWLLRASLVCKPWRRLISHPNFLRRLYDYEHHRKPPVLGFLHNAYTQGNTRFVPTTTFSASVPVPDGRYWYVLDCRHGRALFRSSMTKDGRQDLLIWEPITGHQLLVRMPVARDSWLMNAAVVCAADGCTHRGCHGGPFRLVSFFISAVQTYVRVYSSETSTWDDMTFLDFKPVMLKPSALVGKSLLYSLSVSGCILEFDLTGQDLVVINLPDMLTRNVVLMPTKEGELGAAGVKEACFHLWSRKVSDGGEAGWVQSRVIRLDNMLPTAALSTSPEAAVISFAEEANVIFVSTTAGVFAIELESERVWKVYETMVRKSEAFIPFSSFYIPVQSRGVTAGEQGAAAGARASLPYISRMEFVVAVRLPLLAAPDRLML